MALGKIPLGDRAGVVVDKLLPLLADDNSLGQRAALAALRELPPGDRAGEVIDTLLLHIRPSDLKWRNIEQVIARHGPGGIKTALTALRLVHERELAATGELRAIAHIATGDDAKNEQTELILAWLGHSAQTPVSNLKPENAHKVLELLANHWTTISQTVGLRGEAEARVMEIIYAACRKPMDADTLIQWLTSTFTWLWRLPIEGPVQGCWTAEQKQTVQALLHEFKVAHSSHERALEDHIAQESLAPIGQWTTWFVLGWAILWVIFLIAFPFSRTAQAIFFWNPKVRGLLSLWFVPIILFVLPPLRRRLLAPFRDDLLAGAQLEELNQLGFFSQTLASLNGGSPRSVEEILPALHGTVLIRGDAGLGKTCALRWYAANASRPVAFLSAGDCASGVDTAIARLIHDVQETGFVRSMVYAGALVVIVDGLNEVSADTREKINSFAKDMSKGDVLIGTQPIEWKPPASFSILDLLPFDRQQSENFLRSRPVGSDEKQRCHGAAYTKAVAKFLRLALDKARTEDDRRAAQLMLSNPFDLALAADLLAQGRKPSPYALIDEAFRLADEGEDGRPGYYAVTGQHFPLKRFGRHAITMRVEDRNWFKPVEFPAELQCLLDRKLLVRRSVRGVGASEERIQFRHDRVWDFFIAAAFQEDPDLWEEHLADPRFRGAYLRIAETWDPEAAKLVRDALVANAAEHKDHTTSDEFVKRLETRRAKADRKANASP